ncbi:peptidoglycan DD-metalloendopeptidase family protein [Jeotgalibaca porci]|uniref:Peptidoglycan DD-metalloendopeptidase family protein n=1 Tax=Jeotgalibaca porci TaxID=1868793 RepID=A0A6G7WEQ3_9LACT|nr:M23 family metallopeptidase [Jeotgalibaca porci]QIK50713.1 peptidoglycan DD-metalloendopeptidase family protein [Jeotgalibaca porci]
MDRKQLVKFISIPLLSSLLILPMDVNARSIEDLTQEKEQLEKQLQELDGESTSQQVKLDGLEARKEQLRTETIALQEKIDALTLQMAEQQIQLKNAAEKIKGLDKEIATLEERIAIRREKLQIQARSVQTNGNSNLVLKAVFNSDSLAEMVGNVSVINRIMGHNRDIMTEQKNDQMILQEKKAEAEDVKQELELLSANVEVARTNLVTQKGELENQIEQIAQEYELTEAEKEEIVQQQQAIIHSVSNLSDDMKEEQRRIADEEANKQRAEQEKAEKMAGEMVPESFFEESVPLEYTSADPTPSNPPEETIVNGAGFVAPSNGFISDSFGYRLHPITGEWKLHGGIDFAGSGPIVTAKKGTVLVAGYHSQWGYYVKLDHGNGIETLYAHMEAGSLKVAPGQDILQGQELGIMGTTGESTGVHLHFEVYENGTRVDPAPYLGL